MANIMDEPNQPESIYENQLFEPSSAAATGDSFQQPEREEVQQEESVYANEQQLVDTSGASAGFGEGDSHVSINPDASELAAALEQQLEPQPETQQQEQEHEMATSKSSDKGAPASGEVATGDLLQFESPKHAPAATNSLPPSQTPPQAPGSPLANHTQQQQEEEEAGAQLRNNHSAAAIAAEFQQGSGQSPSAAGVNELCASCGQRVFLVERLVVQKRTYHKLCFKCERCKRTLGVTDYAMTGDHVYCKTHYMELFRQRGKYDFSPDTLPPPADAPAGEEFQNQPEMPKITDIKSRFENPNASTSEHDVSASSALREIGSGQSVQSRLEALRSQQQHGGGDGVPKPRPVDMPHRTLRHDGVGKVAENAPADLPTDVVRSDYSSKHEEELPQANTAKSIAAKFKELQASTATPPHHEQSAAHKPAQLRKSWQPTNGEHGAADANGADVVRSGGPTIAAEELPTEGAARSALSVFQQKEASNKAAAAAPRHFKFQVDDPKRRAAKLSATKPPDARASLPAEEEVPVTGASDVSGAGPAEELPPQGTAKALAARWSTQSTGGAQ